MMKYLSTLRKKFGKHFIFVVFQKPYIVVAEPTSVRRILTDSKTFTKGTDYTEIFAAAFGQGLVTSVGERHKKDRGTFAKYFVKSNIAQYMSMMNEKARGALDELGDCTGGKVHNVEHFFALLALRVFMQFALGYNFLSALGYEKGREKEEGFCKAVSDGSWAVGRMITLGLPMWKIFPAVKNIAQSRAEIWEDMQVVVKERKEDIANGRAPELEDCLSIMIEENMSDQDMNDHLVTLLSAGHDTTAYFSGYFAFLLGQHPEIQERLRKEIFDTLAGREDLTADDITEMQYLKKVMQEVLRLYAIIPSVTRYCTQTTTIKESGVTIPKGANILIPLFLVNRDPEQWENPTGKS